MSPEQCPRYSACRCPICPLWPDWQQLVYLRGESVCPFALEWSKPDSGFRTGRDLRGSIEVQLRDEMARAVPEIRQRFPRIDRELKKAARRPSRRGLKKREGVGHG